jgi:hypothetical protein
MVALTDSFATEAVAKGHTLIFSDFGPEGLERSDPAMMQEWCRRCSQGKVRLRPFNQALVDEKGVRDKRTSERGVVLMILNILPDGRQGYRATCGWYDRAGSFNTYHYDLSRFGTKWSAKPSQDRPRFSSSKEDRPGLNP